MLAVPDRYAHRTKHADWLELCALASNAGRIGFGTLTSAVDLSSNAQPEDISEEDNWQEDVISAVQEELESRRKCVGVDYPFRVDPKGNFLELVNPVTDAGAIYLFCLFLSQSGDTAIVSKELAPIIDGFVRDLFQVCATVAAAGHIQGPAMSFGWPRPEGEAFLAALKRIYKAFGDGTPYETFPASSSTDVKDDGIDIIAWSKMPDGLPGAAYMLGQVASGHNWSQKSVLNDCNTFHYQWFSKHPSTQHYGAMFMPFCVEAKSNDENASSQELLVEHMQHLTKRFGVVFYRYRVACYAAKGLSVHAQGHEVQRIDELHKIVTWVNEYAKALKKTA